MGRREGVEPGEPGPGAEAGRGGRSLRPRLARAATTQGGARRAGGEGATWDGARHDCPEAGGAPLVRNGSRAGNDAVRLAVA